jgi:hypothetical protein
MTYKVLGKTEDLFKGYSTIKGLEGPFLINGRVLYYDVKEGKYWDRNTDFYLSHDEFESLKGNRND